jgi:hypothetical protein
MRRTKREKHAQEEMNKITKKENKITCIDMTKEMLVFRFVPILWLKKNKFDFLKEMFDSKILKLKICSNKIKIK